MKKIISAAMNYIGKTRNKYFEKPTDNPSNSDIFILPSYGEFLNLYFRWSFKRQKMLHLNTNFKDKEINYILGKYEGKSHK